jgi:hypothetical protein
MHRLRREPRQADGHVLGALGFRTAVADPLAAMGDSAIPPTRPPWSMPGDIPGPFANLAQEPGLAPQQVLASAPARFGPIRFATFWATATPS